MINLKITPQEALTIYGLLEGALSRLDDNKDILTNPELIERTMTDIMIKIIHQLEDQEIITKID